MLPPSKKMTTSSLLWIMFIGLRNRDNPFAGMLGRYKEALLATGVPRCSIKTRCRKMFAPSSVYGGRLCSIVVNEPLVPSAESTKGVVKSGFQMPSRFAGSGDGKAAPGDSSSSAATAAETGASKEM
jgi:hypothetical protein